MAVEEGATGALEDEEGEEAPGVGAIEIDVLGVTVGDKDGDEEIEEKEGDEEVEGEAPGVGAIEIDVLSLTVGAVEMNRVGVKAVGADGGEDGAPFTDGADVTDILGVAPLNVTSLTTS